MVHVEVTKTVLGSLAIILGVIVLGLSLVLGPFGVPGDAAGVALMAAGGYAALGKK